MDWLRTGLIAAILVVLYLLLLEWNQFQENHKPVAVSNEQMPSQTDTAPGEPTDIPDIDTTNDTAMPSLERQDKSNGLVHISTDVLNVVLDTHGGDIARVSLPTYATSLENDAEPFVLLENTNSRTYVAQSGLIGANGTDKTGERPEFTVGQNRYVLHPGQQELVVDLKLTQGDVNITKRFIFRRGDFLVDVAYLIDNQSNASWSASLFAQIKRDSQKPDTGSSMLGVQPYVGAAITTDEKNFRKVKFDALEEKSFQTTKTGGWVAMVQHYFISAWVADKNAANHFSLRKLGNRDLYAFGFTSPGVSLEPGEKGELSAQFYAGPKDQNRLEEIAPFLDLVVDYGWLWWLAKPIFWALNYLHGLLGNWGWAIIVLTIGIKAAFFHLSATSYRSMAKMRKLQPEMLRLKDLYGDDRQKLSQEMMGLYKKERVNPMGGCLPILIQMPVFISLYWVLLESVELRHAPWIFWIVDLSVKDPYFILPLLMGASMFVQMQLNPTPPDPMQAKVMQIMPIAFTFFFMFFPAGLVLYWTVNNILSIIQQWVITRKIAAAPPKSA